MERIKTLIDILPHPEGIQVILEKNTESRYILNKALIILQKFADSGERNQDDLEESYFLVQALVDKSWEVIHTGTFAESMEKLQLEKCTEILDDAILIGCTQNVFAGSGKFVDALSQLFDSELDPSQDFQLPILEDIPRRPVKCDINQLHQPSLQEFNEKCFKPQCPALLLNILTHWPALEKWRDLNYILKLAGNRTVPIEIGSNYATDEWSQQLMKIKDFLKRQFSPTDETATDIEYLAQHELFEQIPQLKNDFSIPDYCTLGEQTEAVDIKAWLGPKNTISPMHYDPKHNILCQVFGSKHIILASPQDTENLYPHECDFLSNTSQIDADNLDMDKFPLISQVKLYHLTLQAGDSLYMPKKWWHYVKSKSPSFSVSFWWE